MENELPVGDGIFTDGDKQTETLRESAKALGINPDLVAPEDGGPQLRYFARKGCKHCFGRGTINVCISPSKRKVFWKNERKPNRVSFRQTASARSRRIGPTRPVTKKILMVSEGYPPTREENEENPLSSGPSESQAGWDTRRPEPRDYKENNLSQAFCRCIRAVEV
jgi:hypothetical protein